MRLAFITASLDTGGAEMMLLKLLRGIDRQRFECCVIALGNQGAIGESIERLDIPVTALQLQSSLPSPLKLWRLRSVLKRFKPDLVQTWLYHADLFGGLMARLAGTAPIVWSIRNSNLDPALVKRSTRLVAKTSARVSNWLPDHILCCSNEARNAHVELGYDSNKILVIPNGFDLDRFKPDPIAKTQLRQLLRLNDDVKLIGMVARYDPLKNHLGFIEAAAEIVKSRSDVQFAMVGKGIDSTNTALQQALAAHGLNKRVHLLGPRTDIPQLMAALDVLVSTSHGEAFPNVLGEAMACEVPCVVTYVGDCAEIVGNTGRVAAAGDMRGIANEVLEILSMTADERQQLGQAARQRIQTHYDIVSVVNRYQDFYYKLITEERKDRH